MIICRMPFPSAMFESRQSSGPLERLGMQIAIKKARSESERVFQCLTGLWTRLAPPLPLGVEPCFMKRMMCEFGHVLYLYFFNFKKKTLGHRRCPATGRIGACTDSTMVEHLQANSFVGACTDNTMVEHLQANSLSITRQLLRLQGPALEQQVRSDICPR